VGQHELTVDAEFESKKNTGDHEMGGGIGGPRVRQNTLLPWVLEDAGFRHDAHDEHGNSTTEGRSAARSSITSHDYVEGEGEPSSSRYRRRGGVDGSRSGGWNGTRRMLAGENGTRAAWRAAQRTKQTKEIRRKRL
jgi:hypothetical protein